MMAEIAYAAAFSMFDPTAKPGSIASTTRYGLKSSGVRGRKSPT
jgi:hypothetical protein